MPSRDDGPVVEATRRLRASFVRLASVPLLGALPAIVLTVFLLDNWRRHQIAPDFEEGLYPQAKALLATGVGFDPVHVAISGQNRIYTVVTALVATPLTLIPAGAAGVLVTVLLIGAAAASLRVLGVRDWRLYGLLALWAPVLSGIQTGNLTLLLGLLAAVAWRFREHRFLPGLLIGLAFALKVFMWPLVVWLIATRRFAAALAAAGVGAASILLIVPFGNPVDYFRLANRTAGVMGPHAYSLYALLGSDTGARVAWLVLGSAVLGATMFVDDRSSFSLAILATILFSPIVWIHYFALLLVPLAIARPRFEPLWLVPLAFWLVPFGSAAHWQIVLALGTAVGLVGVLVLGRPATTGPGPTGVQAHSPAG